MISGMTTSISWNERGSSTPMEWFAGNPLDRKGDRKDPAFVENALKGAVCLLLSPKGILSATKGCQCIDAIERNPCRDQFPGLAWPGPRVIWLSLDLVHSLLPTGKDPSESRMLLGSMPIRPTGALPSATGSTGWFWAIIVDDVILEKLSQQFPEHSTLITGGWRWCSGREMLGTFNKDETAIAGHALALMQWHLSHAFCPLNGKPTEMIECGTKRQEIGGKARLYPRIDVAAIFLIVSQDNEHILLGRNARFKGRTGFFSCLAGFVDQGEAIEETVRREAMEEAGVRLGRVQIISSQPWPIGRAGACELMIGCIARAEGGIDGALPVAVPIDKELAETVWFTREQAKEMLGKASGETIATEGDATIPPPIAIAHSLIRHWAFEGFCFPPESSGTGSREGTKKFPSDSNLKSVLMGRTSFAMGALCFALAACYSVLRSRL